MEKPSLEAMKLQNAGVWTWWLWRLAAKNAYNKARRMGMKQGKSWENNNNTKSAEAEIPGSLAVLKVLMGEGFAAAWSRKKCNQSLWEKDLQQHEAGKNATREEERNRNCEIQQFSSFFSLFFCNFFLFFSTSGLKYK